MPHKPLYNAILAAGYISLIATFMNWVTHWAHQPQDNIFMPMSMLALLVLSVSVMAFLFFYQPVIFLLDKKHAEAATFLAKTIGFFAIFAVAFLALALFIIPA